MNSKLSLLIVFISLALLGCQAKNLPIISQDNNSNKPAISAPAEKVDLENLTQNYEQGIKNSLRQFWENNRAAEAKKEILDLKTPSQYLDLHLSLVIALETIEQGNQTADSAKIQSGLEKINQLAEQYSFIK